MADFQETKVVNIYANQYDFYIGRAGKGRDGYFGNPHPIGDCSICGRFHDRPDCLSEYKKDFDLRIENDLEFRTRVLALKGSRIGCFCKPKDCRGDIIKEWLDNQ